jgi:hypothetical protein
MDAVQCSYRIAWKSQVLSSESADILQAGTRFGIDGVYYAEGAIVLTGQGDMKRASPSVAGEVWHSFVDGSVADAGVTLMLATHSLWANCRRWLFKMLWWTAILFVWFIVDANRAKASPVEPLSECEAVQQIQRYCAVSWRNASVPRAEWGDCSQQLFCELLRRVPRHHLALAIAQAESDERKELHRAIWRIIKRHWRSDARAKLSVSWRDPLHSARAKEPDELLPDIVEIGGRELSPRQLFIVQMVSEGYTIAEIAHSLGITAARASDEKYRSIQKIRECFEIE